MTQVTFTIGNFLGLQVVSSSVFINKKNSSGRSPQATAQREQDGTTERVLHSVRQPLGAAVRGDLATSNHQGPR